MTKSPYDEDSSGTHRDSTERTNNGYQRDAEDPNVAGLSPTAESLHRRKKDEEFNETRAGMAGENE